MSANVWLIIGIVFFALAFVAMVVAIVLFFRLDIRGVYRDISGKSATVGIASIREETKKTERQRKTSIAKDDNTNNLSKKLKAIEEEQETELLSEGDETTTALLSEGDETTTELLSEKDEKVTELLTEDNEEVTELLSQDGEEETELLSDESENETELLSDESENETELLSDESESETELLSPERSKNKVELTIKNTTKITHDKA